MLVTLAVVALLFLLGSIAVAFIAHAAMKRLGLDPWRILLWFGLAEAPLDELAARRAALADGHRARPGRHRAHHLTAR